MLISPWSILQTAFEKGYRVVMNYRHDPLLDNVRHDPRTQEGFAELLKKVEAAYPAIALLESP